MPKDPIVIVGIARTPMGGLLGDLSSVEASALGAVAIEGAITSAGIDSASVDEAIIGCVLPAGQGQAPARQAVLKAGLPTGTTATTINKMCGSGMKAIMQAADTITAGNANVVVAGGMESMSRAPHLMPSGRTGTKYGTAQLMDHMALDGL
ncbi:MAG: acetyl-CoA C-acetyltransferase, partial [Kordiimonadaceae bacterium]|nr:acetyl-CoA C-acetyltransferase [Kordiimonadaceae bacterium]